MLCRRGTKVNVDVKKSIDDVRRGCSAPPPFLFGHVARLPVCYMWSEQARSLASDTLRALGSVRASRASGISQMFAMFVLCGATTHRYSANS